MDILEVIAIVGISTTTGSLIMIALIYGMERFNKHRETKKSKNERINDLWARVRLIESDLYVENYFYGCKCCDVERRLLRQDAVMFKKQRYYWNMNCYTDKKSYERHKTAIKRWEKECK